MPVIHGNQVKQPVHDIVFKTDIFYGNTALLRNTAVIHRLGTHVLRQHQQQDESGIIGAEQFGCQLGCSKLHTIRFDALRNVHTTMGSQHLFPVRHSGNDIGSTHTIGRDSAVLIDSSNGCILTAPLH